ncbi:pentapeptide repeat-containing protein [Streptomyces rimosus]|uniref:pentapeptide repeat-containing protein n=1 Tax=Streptomyces rimosus TaxID=1927 RepID=UPI00099B924F|nr:pentapeptide repeat-containing protein [Streptomyces rimosus]
MRNRRSHQLHRVVRRVSRAGNGPPSADGARRRPELDWARLVELTSVLLASVVAVLSLWFSHRQVDNQLRISRDELSTTREGQITERYTAAVGQLGEDSVDVRLGGIYALQRNMEDFPRDHPTIANVLASYIRTHAASPPKGGKQVPPDVLAALDVISSRDSAHDGAFVPDLRSVHLPGAELGWDPTSPVAAERNRAQLYRAILRRADLRNADLSGADLWGARLTGSNLAGADLSRADLRKATPALADLRGADLAYATLRWADLGASDLRGASLWRTDLRGADLYRAKLAGLALGETDLEGADLSGADLTGASVLPSQILATRIDTKTKLPPALANDPGVRAHISQDEQRPVAPDR